MPTPKHRVVTLNLRAAAGAYAGRMALLWPAPHAGYFALPAQRRHLCHIFLARVGRTLGMDRAAYVRDLTKARLADFLRRWAPDAPAGLGGACAKMGAQAWQPAEYRRLVRLLAQCPNAALTIRHLPAVTPAVCAILEILPPPLRRAAILRRVPKVMDAYIVRDAADLVVQVSQEPDVLDRLADRLSRARDRARFADMLAAAIRPPTLILPFEETALLRPLRTPGEVEEAGLRFHNCLSGCTPRAVFGRAAFVEWRGDEPAVMELVYEGAAGWRLQTLLGPNNREVADRTRAAVNAALGDVGVRCTGVPAETLMRELRELAYRD